jgi:hypothetical protein
VHGFRVSKDISRTSSIAFFNCWHGFLPLPQLASDRLGGRQIGIIVLRGRAFHIFNLLECNLKASGGFRGEFITREDGSAWRQQQHPNSSFVAGCFAEKVLTCTSKRESIKYKSGFGPGFAVGGAGTRDRELR